MGKKGQATQAEPAWEMLRTDQTRQIEERLRAAGFTQVDAYRFNSASIRIRIIDPRFEGKPGSERQDMVFPVIDRLPKRIREDILLLLTMAPSELGGPNRHFLVNREFEHPLPSGL